MGLIQKYIITGVKQTEIGVIPDDWTVKKLGTIGSFSKGQGIRKDQVQTDGIPCVRYGEIYTRHQNTIKKYYSFISPQVAETSVKLKKGDLLFAGSGETKEEIGKCLAFVDDIVAYAGGDIVILSPKNEESLFLGYLLNSPPIVIQKASRGQGDAVVHISAKSLSEILITLPQTLTEQRLIATALSDIDALISSLEKLIAKKKAIKQGTMQQLLTGKKRLPGFSGEWENKKFKDYCWFQEGPGLRNWQFTTKGIKVINVTNLVDGFLDLERTIRHISLEEFNKMYQHFEIDDKDIVVASSGNSYAKVAVVRKQDLPLVMNTSVIRFKPLNNLDYLFLVAFLQSNLFKDQIDLLITGGAQPNFGPFHLNKIVIKLPPSKEEQANISKIIYNMDLEIRALIEKQNKYKSIKQGMMQELLTGKTRIV